MSASLSRKLFALDTPYERRCREIDIHYNLEMAASNSAELVQCQRELMDRQRQSAEDNLRATAELATQQGETNDLLCSLLHDMGQLSQISVQTLDAISCQTEIIEAGFAEIVRGLMENQNTLTSIANTLSSPYETEVKELLKEAHKALEAGMRAEGKESQAEFADADRLLRDVIGNPIGSRNYVAWFQVGWMLWQNENKIPEAEEAFFNAVRLSRSSEDLYHLNSLRHLAYMQYLQRRHEEAWETIGRAVSIKSGDHDTLYDAARYAAKTGRKDEAASYLNTCIGLRPHTIVTMFSEEDFIG